MSGKKNACGACERTLHDRLLAQRLRGTSRRTRRTGAGVLAFALFAGAGLASLSPAHATAYGGFGTEATASPLKLEVFEPAIPIPTDPQLEFDFSYTRVEGDSGPTSTARSSALWPGPAVGEGLKTFGEQLGFPDALTGGGYPVQSNAQYPSDTTQASGEPLPGQIQRVAVSDKRAVAKAGYTPSGDLSDGDAGDGSGSGGNDPLQSLQNGDLSALGGLLTGSQSGNNDKPVQTNPLGDLSLLIDADGMTSVSSTDYDGDTVTSTATSRIGRLKLLLGLITLDGVNVVTKVTSSLDGGAKVSKVVDIGSMTIAGKKFGYGPEGFTAAGKTTATPDLPKPLTDLLKTIGVSIDIPKPTVAKDGLQGSVDAEALSITLDTKPLRSKLPSLPLDQLVSKLPDLPGQAAVLKGLLLSLNTISPKLVLHLGQASATATTVQPIDFGSPGGNTSPPSTGTGGAPTGGTAVPPPSSSGAIPGDSPAADAGPSVTSPINQVSSVPGLPKLGNVSTLLVLAGLALAAGIGWYLRRAGLLLFGGSAACTHGLKAGIPDLRKV